LPDLNGEHFDGRHVSIQEFNDAPEGGGDRVGDEKETNSTLREITSREFPK